MHTIEFIKCILPAEKIVYYGFPGFIEWTELFFKLLSSR